MYEKSTKSRTREKLENGEECEYVRVIDGIEKNEEEMRKGVMVHFS